MNYTRIIKAFIIFANEPGGPGAFFNQLSEFTQIFGSTIYVAQTLVGDSVVVSSSPTAESPKRALLNHKFIQTAITSISCLGQAILRGRFPLPPAFREFKSVILF